MSLKVSKNIFDKPIAEWPIFYKDGLPFIYDDDKLFHDEEGNRLGEHPRHTDVNHTLPLVLEWLYDGQNCPITKELTFRASVGLAQAGIVSANAIQRGYVEITPDIAVLKGVAPLDTATYHIGPGHPPPAVVFEIGSPSTYLEDLSYKFIVYEQVIQAAEYIAYDPHQHRLWEGSRVKGWRLVNGRSQEMRSNEQGWLWSEELQSWLVEDNEMLRLYDAQGNRRLTKAEYQTARADQASTRAEQERARAEEANARAELEKAKAEQERARAEEANARAELEKIRANQLATRLLALEAQLKQLNQAPDDQTK